MIVAAKFIISTKSKKRFNNQNQVAFCKNVQTAGSEFALPVFGEGEHTSLSIAITHSVKWTGLRAG